MKMAKQVKYKMKNAKWFFRTYGSESAPEETRGAGEKALTDYCLRFRKKNFFFFFLPFSQIFKLVSLNVKSPAAKHE